MKGYILVRFGTDHIGVQASGSHVYVQYPMSSEGCYSHMKVAHGHVESEEESS